MNYGEKIRGLELGHTGEIWDRRVYTRFKSVCGVVFDIGSTDGCFGIFALLNGAKKVYALEANATREYKQRRNIEALGWSNRFISLHVTVGDRNKDVKIATDGDFVGDYRSTYATNVVMRTLDQVIKDFNVEMVNFVKIDVEGGEISVLLGAKELIVRDKPVFSIASYHAESYKMDGGWNSESQLDEVLLFFRTFFPEYEHDVCFDDDGNNPIVTFWVEE